MECRIKCNAFDEEIPENYKCLYVYQKHLCEERRKTFTIRNENDKISEKILR